MKNEWLIDDPCKRVYGMDESRKRWCALNRFRTNHGCCGDLEYRWGRRLSALCEYGELQTMSHIVNDCVLSEYPGGLIELHRGAEDSTIYWILCAYDR